MEFYNKNKISTGEWGIVKGDLPKGCEYCIKGLKSVIFVTGKCTWPWWCRNFCPVSLDRKNYDVIFVNELKIGFSNIPRHEKIYILDDNIIIHTTWNLIFNTKSTNEFRIEENKSLAKQLEESILRDVEWL